jgi:hypothetical protein
MLSHVRALATPYLRLIILYCHSALFWQFVSFTSLNPIVRQDAQKSGKLGDGYS